MINLFQKWISDIKFLQNHGKLRLSMISIGFYINYDPKRSKNGLKRSKMIKNDPKIFKMIQNDHKKSDFLMKIPGSYEKIPYDWRKSHGIGRKSPGF